jgi:hypothetical protein
MAQANDSILVTPGSGATVATHLVNGKEYQVIMLADTDGHIQHSGDIYKALYPSQAAGASKLYLDLFNATGTGKTMKVHSIFATVDNDTAVTGTLGVQLSTFRTTAIGTGGTAATADGVVDTAATISKWNTSTALPAGVTSRLNPTGGATQGAWLGSRWLFTEETNAASGIAGTIGADFILDLEVPLIVGENTGIRINQGTVASVGQLAFEILFEFV